MDVPAVRFTDRHGDTICRLPMTDKSAYPHDARALDSDGEPASHGAPTGEELRAGTDPRRADSVLRMASLPPGGGPNVGFSTATARQYRVETCTNLADGGWIPLPGVVVGTGGTVAIQDAASTGLVQRFYRARLANP